MSAGRTLAALAAAGGLLLAACASAPRTAVVSAPQRQLAAAVRGGRLDDVLALVKENPQIGRMRSIDMALRYAAIDDQAALIPDLVAQGADVNGGQNSTPLGLAAARGADVNRAVGRFHRTALMTAALRGKTEAVRALLAAGADRAALDANGRNAAFFGRRRPEIAALLGAPAGADAAPAAPVAVAAPMPNPNANAAAAPAPAAAPAAPPEPTISKEEASDALEP